MDPTPAQLEAAGLTEVTTYEEIETAYANDAGPLRTWNAKNQNFPPVTSGYVKVGWQNVPTPQPQPVPVPTPTPEPSGASGIPIPPVAAALTRALVDDFTGTSLDSTKWNAPYNGESGGTATGYFISEHTVLKGDSIARFQAYPDPTNIVKCWEYNATLGESLAYWGGAGTHSNLTFGPGSLTQVCMKFDTYPGIAPMAIYYGGEEIDFAEFNQIPTKGGSITKFSATIHWGNHADQAGIECVAPVDFSQWHVFALNWSATGLTISCDGAQVGSFTFTATQISGGVNSAQNLCLQIQTGDVMPNPPADPSVSASSPIELLVDWVTVDVPV